MKSSYNVTVALFCGALGISFAACASSSDNPTGGGTAGQTANGTAGSGAVGAAGSNSGVAGSSVGAAGSSVGAAGSTGVAGAGTGTGGFNTGVGGSTGSAGAGTGTAGAATGTGGAPAMSCGTLTPVTGDAKCCVAAGTATDLAIDDFEDGDNVIKPIGQRQGYWYTYGTDPTQTPAPASFMGKTFVPMAGGHSPLFSGETMGSVPANMTTATPPVYNQAGLGVGFNNHFNKSCGYDASAYKGITFWGMGNVAVKVQISTPGTTPPSASTAGTCTLAADCYDPHYITAALLPGTWKQFTITFADTATFSTNASKLAFQQNQIMDLQFQVDGAATGATAYSFSIDDVAFF